MSISSVQAQYGQYESHCVRKTTSASYRRETGPDTVTFSEQACKMAASKDETGPSVKQQETPLKSSGFNILGMLLESLFLAELEESKAPASDANGDPATQQEMREKPDNLLKDGGKVAEIKRVIEDFSAGKVSLSDVPQAMSSSNSATHGATLKNTNVSEKDDTKKD